MSIKTDVQNKFFQDNLESTDPQITKALQQEYDRQSNQRKFLIVNMQMFNQIRDHKPTKLLCWH